MGFLLVPSPFLTCFIGLVLFSSVRGDFTCNDGYSCYEDPSRSVVWITGPGTCSNMCSNGLTGDSDYYCKGNQPVYPDDASFDHIAQGLGFDCNDGSCWGGSTGSDMMWIAKSGTTRECYYPSEATYGCNSAIGNANCFGTRFNLVCPCETEEVRVPTPTPTCSIPSYPFLPCKDGYTCWKDEIEDIVWVIGGDIFRSCKDTCESALDMHTDFYACKSDQNTHTSKDVFEYISDGMGFTCKSSECGNWDVDGGFWVDRSDNCERTCHSSADGVYSCHGSVGNANCFSERYTQACPCNAKPLDEACEWDCPNHSAEIAKWPEDEEGDSCLERINYWRKKACEDGWPECPPAGLPPYVECTACHQCANTQSEYDSVHGSHASFTRCGDRSQGSGGGRTCKDVIDGFVSEREGFGGLCKGHCGPIVSPGCNTFHWGRSKDPNGAGFYHYTLNWGSCNKNKCNDHCNSVEGTSDACFASGIETPSCSATEPTETSVEAQIPMSVELDGISEVPDDDDELQAFGRIIQLALMDSCGGEEVVIISINGMPLKVRNKVSVEFNVILNILCDGTDCSSALESVTETKDDVFSQVSTSMSDGSFVASLVSSATEFAVEGLSGVSVNASTLSSEEPYVDVSTNPPTETPMNETMPSDDEESINFLIAFLQRIIDFLISLLDILR